MLRIDDHKPRRIDFKHSWLRYIDLWRGHEAAGWYGFVWNWRKKK